MSQSGAGQRGYTVAWVGKCRREEGRIEQSCVVICVGCKECHSMCALTPLRLRHLSSVMGARMGPKSSPVSVLAWRFNSRRRVRRASPKGRDPSSLLKLKSNSYCAKDCDDSIKDSRCQTYHGTTNPHISPRTHTFRLRSANHHIGSASAVVKGAPLVLVHTSSVHM